MDTRLSPTRERLHRLRDALRAHAVDGVLIPSSDPHLSEYLPLRWQGREWFSGFTGSAGTLVVTATQAALFADGRYWSQAEREIDGSGIELVKIPTASAVHHLDWIVNHLQPGQTLAVDGQVMGLAGAQQLARRCIDAGLVLRTDLDVIDAAWPERAGLPQAPLFEHRPPHAPLERTEKLAQLRQAMAGHGATHHLVSTLDDVAWLTNLRGADVDYNPVFLAHLLVGPQQATLYVGAGKVSDALRQRLIDQGLSVADYAQVAQDLSALPADAALLLDPKRVTWGLRERVPAGVRVIEAINPSTLAKSRKTDAEAEQVREAMIEDGAAMCAFYARFEAALARGEVLTELTVDEWLSAERARRPGFMGLSFPTIAGFNGNGAMPHYRATAESHATIRAPGLLLIDSGGQYLGGTTDITRVWAIGEVSAQQRQDFTLVLKGMLQLSGLRFPVGTPGPMIDALARTPLWSHSMDYGHGTGHGVGYFLNVHEGPQVIGKTVVEPHMAMQAGMITSNEPGLYRPGQWGVRIENLLLTVPAPSSEFGAFLAFETLTLCPIDARCIDLSLLRDDELDVLNRYHATVRERVAPRVQGEALAWLLARTEALTRAS